MKKSPLLLIHILLGMLALSTWANPSLHRPQQDRPCVGSVSGTVTFASAKAASATIKAQKQQGGAWEAGSTVAVNIVSGKYTASNLIGNSYSTPTNYKITASAPGYKSQSKVVKVKCGQPTTGINFKLTK